ncbi:hypothetical protein TSUD_19700 [Trifolium subterraneum]|uniref:Ubiquitin carboxyl-terminal hydrolase n=1 Tax=Trifolium subterraneum TaxID=3900 RepID=A0A2Z6MUW0_TRISU|nr:hypothetical protein TSUD_19700 [Trifolium subterraneum]
MFGALLFSFIENNNLELFDIAETQHQFNARESDWGFTNFMPLSELYDPSRGYVVDDRCILEADVNVRKDLDYWAHDSKKETGCVGLKNQGATCYMNSLLQTLYHIPYFRKAVYHMPTTENDMPSGSIPLALQSLFYKLQYNDSSVSTKELTKSFGWDTYDSFMQHDVQELNRVLCEKLEDKMKGTVVEGTIQQLFEGHHMNYIECITVDYKSTRKESFYDLQLDVKGCKDVYASFDKYVEVERLEGDNKYHAEQYGLQEAKKGVLFIDFPPVLQLQLKRFEYDFVRDTMVKINDRYEFPLQLDLDRDNGKYLSPEADRSIRNLYTLHSVLVHSGGVHGGHYYAYIRPTLSNQWFKFDDERVTKEDTNRALEEQYGGEEELPHTNPGFNNSPFKFTKYSNAYMLVYVRESDKDKIICNVDEKDIAKHLRIRLKKEQEEKEKKKKEKAEAHLYTIVKGPGNLLGKIGEVPPDYHFADPDLYGLEVGQLREVSNKANNAELRLFLEIEMGQDLRPIPPPEKLKEELLLFFKLYEPSSQKLRYVGRLFVMGSRKPVDILMKLNEMAGFAPDEEIDLFEEIKFEPKIMCEHVDKKSTFRENQHSSSCRSRFAPRVWARKLATFKMQPKPQPIKYRGVDHLSDMLVHYNQASDILYYEVLDIPLPELQCLKTLKIAFHHDAKDEVMIIRLPKLSTVADVINDLKSKVDLSHPDAELRLLEVFNHKIYKIFHVNENIENINDHYWTLRAEEGPSVETIFNFWVSHLSFPLVLLQFQRHPYMIYLVSPMQQMFNIPEEEKNLGPHDRMIHVYHFLKDTAQNQMHVQNFGDPFFLVIHEGEALAEVKLRVQKKLQVPNEEFLKWKFAFVSLGRPEYLQDSDIISSRFQELASVFSTRFSNNIVILFGCLEKGHIRRMGAVSWTGAH